jgi:PAS domain S-box-containing protein
MDRIAPLKKKQSQIAVYGAAVLAAVVATLIRAALIPLVGYNSIPFITYFPAVLFVAWYGGFRAATLSIILSTLAADYYFIYPTGSVLIPLNPSDQIALLVFLVVGVGMALLGDSQRQALQRAEWESERRRDAEMAEREHRQRLETTLSSIGDAVLATDAKGRVVFANGVARSLLGSTETEILGKHLDEVFHIVNEYTRAPVESPVMKVLREGAVVGIANHTVLLSRDGREIPIDDSAAPIRDADGALQGTVLVFRDVTARRLAEQTRALLSSIVESSDDAIISKDVNGVVTSWNEGAERMFGYSAEEILGKPISIVAPPGAPDDMPAVLERLRKGERIEQYETVRRAKNGLQVSVSVTVSPLYDALGRIVGASKIARDITERKTTEERLRLTVEAAPSAMIMVGREGRITLVNSQTEKLFGYNREELLGQFVELLVPERYRAGHGAFRTSFLHAPSARAMGSGRDLFGKHKNGSEIPIEIGLNPITTDQGDAVLAAVIDITERKKAEERLQRTNQELSRANEALQQFAFAASHDLQEPLRMITSYSQLLLSGYRGPVEGEAAVCVKFISQGTTRMRELLADLLAYTQVSTDGELSHERVDLNLVAGKAVENLRTAIEESRAAVTIDRLPTIRGQNAHFVQIFQNLLGNAIKYRTEQAPVIHVSSEREYGLWRISVSDNGIGIDPEYQSTIFRVFKRLHGKTVPGTGMGLAICQRVVERHGGRIWVESKPGGGSTFHFTVPAAETAISDGEGANA